MQKPLIDFVITWVDGFDPVWKAEKQKYEKKIDQHWEDSRDERYRPMDTFYYLFRGIEMFAPWVNKIYLVTYGHLPKWLNTKNDKLIIVKHTDFIPIKYLPTFNVAPIELNFHRIKGLSENFVYFNDDMFLIKPTKPEDFFVNNKPCDSAVLNAFCASRINGEKKLYLKPVINMSVINSYFSKSKTISSNPINWYNLKYGKELFRTFALSPWRHFTGFVNWHLPYSLHKSTFEELWKLEGDYLNEVCMHRFRQATDVNIWLFSYWQYAKNDFCPRSPYIGTHFSLANNMKYNERLFSSMIRKKTKLLCINDEFKNNEDFKSGDKIIANYFKTIFPKKSKFEL